MTILIIEDEPVAREKLILFLERHPRPIHIAGMEDSVGGSVQWLLSHAAPDLILLDIHLSDGLCFDIFKQVNVQSPIIFTTAYDQHALAAFKLHSIDYLLKPIRQVDLDLSLNKFHSMKKAFNSSVQRSIYDLLPDFLPQQNSYKQRFLVKSPGRVASISVDDIAYFYASEKIVLLVTADNRQIPVNYTIEALSETLDPEVFFHVNRQFLISYRSIDQMYMHTNSRIKVTLRPKEAKELIVSNDKTVAFKEWLDR